VQWFKTMTTNEYIRGVRQQGWRPFPRNLWQRNYYEHIIWNDRAFHAIRRYIQANPLLWDYDHGNLQAKGHFVIIIAVRSASRDTIMPSPARIS